MLDPLNCTEVHSVPSLNHPSAREDVRTIAACAQIAKDNCPPLMELLCPFQLLYTDDVEQLAAESARERVCWVSAIWYAIFCFHKISSVATSFREVLDHTVTLLRCLEPGSPAGSIRTIHTITSATSASGSGSGSGSASTMFVLPLHTIPSLSDLSDSSSTHSQSHAPSLPRHHMHMTDNGTVSNQSYIYYGDPCVIAPS